MGAKYTKAQAAASKKYMEGKTTLRVVVTEDKAVTYKKAAKEEGKSLSRFMADLADDAIAKKAQEVQV